MPVPVCDLDSSNEPAEIMSPSPKKVRNDDCYLEDSVGLNQSNSSKDMPENNFDAFEYSSPNATLTASTASPVLSPTSTTSQVATELVHQSGQTFLDISPVATSSPVQPLGIKFPVTLYSNKPNPAWFQHYPWLEYSIRKDACFCFPCCIFGSDGAVLASRPEKTFTEVGFKDWKHAMGKDGTLKGHNDSLYHKHAVVAWEQFNKKGASIIDQMGENRQEEVQKNWYYIKTLCAKFCYYVVIKELHFVGTEKMKLLKIKEISLIFSNWLQTMMRL